MHGGTPPTALPVPEAAFLGLLVQSSGDGVYATGADGLCTFANPACARLLGYDSPDDLIGRPIDALIGADMGADMGAGEAGDTLLRRRDGSRFPAELRRLTPADREEEGAAALVSFTDVSGRRRAAEQFRLMAQAVAQSQVAVVFTDAAGAVTYVNARFTAMTGVPGEAVADLDGFVRGFGGSAAEVLAPLWQALAAGEAWRGDCAGVRPDGAPYWVSIGASPVRDDTGRVVQIVASAEDVTEHRLAEEHLRRAQKMQAVGVLAGGIAHDFNNILTVILGYSLLAVEELPEGSALRDDIAQIAVAANRAKGLVQDLLTFSRVEPVGGAPVDLRPLVEEALRLVLPAIPERVAVRFAAVPDAPMPVRAAAGQVQQAVINLCRNAADAIGEGGGGGGGGTIAVTLDQVVAERGRVLARARLAPGRYVRLTVTDDGCGIDPAILDRIFEPFFTTKPVDKGTGLGLAAVHGIVAEHGGVIDVTSAPGRGASFALYLPAHEEHAPQRAERPVGRGRVLLVDPDRATLGMTARLLRSQGYTTVATVNGRRALALFAIEPARFDLVVLVQNDAAQAWRLLMLARAFAASAPAVPILACAAGDPAGDAAALHGAGVARVLGAPVEPAAFLALVGPMVRQGDAPPGPG